MTSLPEHTKFNVRMFADDTVLFIREKNLNKLEQIVTAELQKISDWTNFNRLSLNANKSCYMIVPSKKYKNRASNFKLILCGNVIHQTDTVKYLGLHLQDNLKSNSQINYVLKKVSQAAGIISKIRHFVNKKTLVMMYYSFVYCHLHYGILTWANSSVSMLKPLKIMQNHILRLMSFKKIKDKVDLNKLYASFNILKLEDIYNLELAKFVYLYHYNALPEIFKNYFKHASEYHNYSTRYASNQNFFIPRMLTSQGQSSSLYIGPQIWNNISLDIRSLSCGRFKKVIKKSLISKYA